MQSRCTWQSGALALAILICVGSLLCRASMPPISRPASVSQSLKSIWVGMLLSSSRGAARGAAHEPAAEPPMPYANRAGQRSMRRRPPLRLPVMSPLSPFENAGQRLQALRDGWRPTVAVLRQMPQFAAAYAQIDRLLAHPEHRLVRTGSGGCNAYALQLGHGAPQWVVKPADEDARGPNHVSDSYAGPDFPEQRFRPAIPLLTAPQRELASGVVAHALGLDHVLPDAVIMPVDFAGHPHQTSGVPGTVKLCSVARFVPNAMHAADFWAHPSLLHNATFETDNLAENMLLNWALYDTDAHGRNTLVSVAGDTDLTLQAWAQLPAAEQALHRLQLTRIDTGLALPEQNHGLRNDLATTRQAHEPLTAALRSRFLLRLTHAALHKTAASLDALGLYPDGTSNAGAAYMVRMRTLRGWLQREPQITLAEINQRFMEDEAALIAA